MPYFLVAKLQKDWEVSGGGGVKFKGFQTESVETGDENCAFSSPEAALLLVSIKKSRPLAWSNDILFLNGFVNTID